MSTKRDADGSGESALSVVDVAISRLKKRIESGEFAPGQRLPPETALANELELSRPSLREAVRALAMAGVLDVRRGDGTFVTDLRPDRLVRAIGSFLDLANDTGLDEMLECRKVIEPGATALAATRIDAATLDALHQRIERMRTLHDPEELVREDLAFHADIVAATGNRTLESLLSSVTQQTARARVWRALIKSDVLAWTHEQHMDIYRALRAHDSLAAFTAANRHVNDVDAWVRDRLDAVRDRA
ncbi:MULTISPECIES: FadR/GntR family transcriptional regulator [unclassified Streptomyces]|uniref:FadR/GntR family transcriptional regulator n=1 Tax=unclassified Streptomyces TaxID=2593676 RepID=UPI002250CF9C|nr:MULTISPECIES: FadR/GntR family transcriptional regulator [unclassified Streptomyces]MCX5442387.1 FadR family transcriptional regulator [Streptomyces sp. NBC_00063]WUB91392.1 FadR family transcriptional regulator [Streptomyces sp. NBC_00569]